MPEDVSFSYSVSVNGGDWCWELMRRSHVIGRGVAATQSRAYVDALSAALAYTEIDGHRHSSPKIDRSSRT